MAQAPAPRKRPPLWVGLALFCYGTAAALFFCFVVFRRQGLIDSSLIDLNGFGGLARNIARGRGFTLGFGPTIRRAPLFPYWAALLMKLFGPSGLSGDLARVYRPVLVGNCIVFGLTVVVVWRLAARFGAGVGVLAALACPLVPQCLRYVGMTEVETMMGLWTALLAWTGLALWERPSWKAGLAFGATAAAATLTKPVALFYPPLFLLAAAWGWRKRKASVGPAVVAGASTLAIFGLLLLPWTLRNVVVTHGGFKGISSNGPGEFLRGYVNAQAKYFLLRQNFGGGGAGETWDPEANRMESQFLAPYGVSFYRYLLDSDGNWYLSPPPPASAANVAELELAKDRIESAEVKRRVIHDPVAFLRKLAIQTFTFWYIVETRTKSVLVGLIAAVVLALAAAGSVRGRQDQISVWPVWAVVIYFNLIYAVFLAFARYSMPLYPTLTALATAGAVTLGARVTAGWRARLG